MSQGAAGPAPVDSTELFRGKNVLLIRHRDELYRLTITKQGKLILTK